MTTLQSRALLFDLDGTLIDTKSAVERCWTEWAVEHGIAPSEVFAIMHGRRSMDIIEYYFPGKGTVEAAIELERRVCKDVDGVVALPGVKSILEQLPEGRWAVVTSGTEYHARTRLQQMGLPVPNVLVSADKVTNGKPHPEPYLQAARQLGVDPKDCIVFEDAPAGIKSGKAAGMLTIAVLTSHVREEIVPEEPTVVVQDLTCLDLRGEEEKFVITVQH
ncbi:uncharacterized protein VTP21DRAFT_1872 [Calcarisporiella thermophila]|uniref:uncharacterized protein n=1 Tax=Calcarisporiella thermophila TaxID=911321 RepID=UPI00374281B7